LAPYIFSQPVFWALRAFARPALRRIAGFPSALPWDAQAHREETEIIDSFFPVGRRTRGIIFDTYDSNPDIATYPPRRDHRAHPRHPRTRRSAGLLQGRTHHGGTDPGCPLCDCSSRWARLHASRQRCSRGRPRFPLRPEGRVRPGGGDGRERICRLPCGTAIGGPIV
jgi:hypothetical protein